LHQFLQFRLLIRSQRRLHVELVMNIQFLSGQLRGADLLELSVNRRAIRSGSRHQLPQFQMLYFESSAALNTRLLEVSLLLRELRHLIGSDAELLSQRGIIHDPAKRHLPAPAHSLPAAESLSHATPTAASPHAAPAAEVISAAVAHATTHAMVHAAMHSVVTPVPSPIHMAAHTAAHAIAP
jgi:hypothetical protein